MAAFKIFDPMDKGYFTINEMCLSLRELLGNAQRGLASLETDVYLIFRRFD
jgi:Ca2+-binding EF-hand superfamily protein